MLIKFNGREAEAKIKYGRSSWVDSFIDSATWVDTGAEATEEECEALQRHIIDSGEMHEADQDYRYSGAGF